MSAELERIKKLATNDMIVAAVEIPSNHRAQPLVADDLEEILGTFDDDVDYAHFVIRVKRATQPLPKPSSEPQPPQLSIDSMVTETLELSDKLTGNPYEDQGYEPDFLFENAKLLEENKDFELARNIYRALVKKGALIPKALGGMARTFEKEGDGEKAIRCYREAIAYASELEYYQGIAAIQIRLGEDEAAAETLLHSLALPKLSDENRFELHKSLGNCYTRLGDYAKAEHHYRKAYEINADSDILQVNVGSLALQKTDYDSARKHFQKALELNTKNEKAVSGMGMVHLGTGNAQKAHDCFVASLELNLGNLGAIYNLVKCAYETKRFGDASRLLSRYIESFPVNTNILYSYAGILFHQGEYRLAAAEVEKILEGNPAHSGARELKEMIGAKLG
jgi:tetratricopeptide (TPR) repeat protein